MHRYAYRWIPWNVEHIGTHEVSPDEAEWVVDRAERPWPEKVDRRKWLVRGRTVTGRYLQVVYTFDPPPMVFVIHARNLTDGEKRQWRRRAK